MEIKVVAVNISDRKGTVKRPVPSITLTLKGIKDDAHAGSWHRQVSMLAQERIDAFAKEAERDIKSGEFAENITTLGIDLTKVNLLDRFKIGDALLEVTQIGKKCHGEGCAIYREVGTCVMPKEGIFCRVLEPGTISSDSEIEFIPKALDINIITLSDRASSGEYEDLSGPQIEKGLEAFFAEKPWGFQYNIELIPDSPTELRSRIASAVEKGATAIFTTGGTGIGPNDITTDTVKDMIDKEIPGIMEYIRIKYGEKAPGALISRSIAGVIDNTLIFCLPGSVKAVKEYISEILKIFEHLIFMIKGINRH